MDFNEYVGRLKSAGVYFKANEPLSRYAAYGVGGAAKLMVFPNGEKQMELALSGLNCCYGAGGLAKSGENAENALNERFFVLGGGTNVLCSDSGFNGIVINTAKADKITVSGISVIAECGAKLSRVRELAELNCLSGLEFTEGIPATIGGAVCMNAGCFTKSVGDKIAYVKAARGVYNRENCFFDYRKSRFSQGDVIIKACFLLKPSEADIIAAKREKYKRMRKNSQPHGKSCGCVFQNDGYFAGKLIDTAGLKGYSVGGAHVSEKHANFIINEGGTAADVYKLIALIKQRVLSVHGVLLKEEIKYLGDFGG